MKKNYLLSLIQKGIFMEKFKYKEKDLSDDGVLANLFVCLSILRDSFDLINQGKVYQTTVLYGQLRSLLIDIRGKKSPLLFKVAEIFNHEISLYYTPPKILPEEYNKGTIFSLTDLNFSKTRKTGNQVEILLSNFLDKDVYSIENQSFSWRHIIEKLSNNYGGSHYSYKAPDHIELGLRFGMNNMSPLETFLLQFARIIFKIGIDLLRFTTNLTIYFSTFIKKDSISKESRILLDCKIENLNNRITISTVGRLLKISFIDYFGNVIIIEGERQIEFSKLKLICIKAELTYDLETHISFYYDDELIGFKKINFPLYLFNQDNLYDFYLNTNAKKETQEYEFGFHACFMVNENESYFKSAIRLQETLKHQGKIKWIGSGNFLFSYLKEGKVFLKYNKPERQIDILEIQEES